MSKEQSWEQFLVMVKSLSGVRAKERLNKKTGKMDVYFSSPSQNIEARALAKWIIENKPNSFILREIYNDGNIANLRRNKQAQKAAKKLISLGWLSESKSRAGGTKGRPKITYYVNPEVYELAENY